MKECRGCGKSKNEADFHLDKRWNIRRSQCKQCQLEYERGRRQAAPRKPKSEAAKAANKRWLERNTDTRRKYEREYYRKNTEKINARRRKGSPGYGAVMAAVQRRRGRLANAEGTHTEQEWDELRESYGNICLRCGDTERIVRDHVVALSRGGTNDITNLQPLCVSCNSSKGTATVDYRE